MPIPRLLNSGMYGARPPQARRVPRLLQQPPEIMPPTPQPPPETDPFYVPPPMAGGGEMIMTDPGIEPTPIPTPPGGYPPPTATPGYTPTGLMDPYRPTDPRRFTPHPPTDYGRPGDYQSGRGRDTRGARRGILLRGPARVANQYWDYGAGRLRPQHEMTTREANLGLMASQALLQPVNYTGNDRERAPRYDGASGIFGRLTDEGIVEPYQGEGGGIAVRRQSSARRGPAPPFPTTMDPNFRAKMDRYNAWLTGGG